MNVDHDHTVMTLETVTPAIAGAWLTQNTHNRKPKQSNVDRYARDMEADHWPVTGDSIKFNWDDVLIDGQNRLRACIKANRPFVTYVIRGLAPDVQVNVDSGVKRTFGDILKINGESQTAMLAAAVRAGLLWEMADAGGYSPIGYSQRAVSPQEQGGWLVDNPGIRKAVKVTARLSASFLHLPSGPVAAVAYRALTLALDDAEYFFEEALIKGDNLAEGSPALALRAWLLRQQSQPGHVLPPYVYQGIFIKAWNCYINGQSVKRLTWRRGGRQPEQFQTMVGTPED